jgi:molecular chaperone DnaK (HSP70)
MMPENDKTAIQVISDYLRMIWKHTLQTIMRDRGSAVEALQFHVVITVPAIWKDYTRPYMTEAAKKAGILNFRTAGETRFTFAPEPEAAALSSLSEPGRRVKPNEVYLVCDAGGGTVVSPLMSDLSRCT